jgi:hypothetical protein
VDVLLASKHTEKAIYINPMLQTWFGDSCFTCDGSSAIQFFKVGNSNFTILEFSPISEGNATIQSGGGLPVTVGGGGAGRQFVGMVFYTMLAL